MTIFYGKNELIIIIETILEGIKRVDFVKVKYKYFI